MTITPVENSSPSAGSPPTLASVGNEKAEVLAKRAIHLPPANHNAVPLQDYVPSIRSSIRASWYSRWDQCVADKLSLLKSSLGPWSSYSQLCRRLKISLSLLVSGILVLHTVI